MQLWKPLVLIVPAGLALGMIGGNLARPVMQERAVEPWQSIFGRPTERSGSADYPVQPAGPMTYVGGYSYPPDTSDWTLSQEGERAYADSPLPTVAELDARQAELLADPDVEFAVSAPAGEPAQAEKDPPEPATRMAFTPVELGAEPRTADGKLPAIW